MSANELTGKVLIVMGSDSDFEVMRECAKGLQSFGIPFDMKVCSAHRTPDDAHELSTKARESGVKVIVAAAGLAAHLGGVMAAGTTLPVIGVPLQGGALHGVDSLYATVMMPGGIPVATMAVGKPGAKNAAIFAAQILSLSDDDLAARLVEFKKNMVTEVHGKNHALQDRLAQYLEESR